MTVLKLRKTPDAIMPSPPFAEKIILRILIGLTPYSLSKLPFRWEPFISLIFAPFYGTDNLFSDIKGLCLRRDL